MENVTTEQSYDDPISVLFVDDDANFIRGLKRSLQSRELEWDVRFFSSPADAMAVLEQIPGSVIVSGWMMPEMDGLEFCQQLRRREHVRFDVYHYFILLTGRQDGDSLIRGFDNGADDFLAKPFQMDELLARIRVGCRIVRLQRRLRDANEQLLRQATVDPLTGTYNRRRGAEIIEEELERVRRNRENLSLLLIDLDKFKGVNDTYGHAAGDAVLQAVVSQIKNNSRKYDSLIRWGGDEFLLVCPHTSQTEAVQVSDRICQAVAGTDIEVEPGQTLKLSISIGAGVVGSGGLAGEKDLVALADQALYQVKSAGGNHCRVLAIPSES